MIPFPCKKCRCSHKISSGTKFGENISTVFELLSRHHFQTEIFKGHNSPKNEGRVMVLNPCTSSYDALYLVYICTKFHENILDGIEFSKEKNSKGHNSVKKCRWSYGSCSLQSSNNGYSLHKSSPNFTGYLVW